MFCLIKYKKFDFSKILINVTLYFVKRLHKESTFYTLVDIFILVFFSVLFNLAIQYENNEMYTEALNTYQVNDIPAWLQMQLISAGVEPVQGISGLTKLDLIL